MGALPIVVRDRGKMPDYLPARMVNEFTYCPRLFFYEWVEGLFAQSVDTVEGTVQHKRVDAKTTALPEAAKLPQSIHSRSVTLSSERLRVIARMDLVEADGRIVTPVDYKHGRPRDGVNGLELWPSDRAQLAVQGIVLRDSGYACEEGIAYYRKTGQRVRVAFDDVLITETEGLVEQAWSIARAGEIPTPLEDSPKCPGCSLVGICLPDETLAAIETDADPRQLSLFGIAPRKPVKSEVRALVTPRNEQRPLYLNSQGVRVGKSGAVLQVKEEQTVLQEVRMGEICQVNVMGNVQLSTQAIQALCEAEVPICYFSMGGWFYGITTGLNQKNVFLRHSQFRLSEQEYFSLAVARRLTAGKIRNQRTLLQRNHVEPKRNTLDGLKGMAERAETATRLDELLGIEGNAARLYFGEFAGMIKPDKEGGSAAEIPFDFEGRNRRPPRDPVNALLSLAYSLLAKDLTVTCFAVGFDPYVGFYHQPRFGRPALALDLMEPFRPIIADSAVLTAINTGMVVARDFVRAGGSVALTAGGRKGFLRAYELRMDTLVTHPLFEYRVTYRRLLEIQARLLARVLEGEIGEYPVFTTR